MMQRSFLALMFLLPPLALAGEEVDRSLPAMDDGVVKIINTRGEVKVEGWEKHEVSVEGELDDLAEGLVFESDSVGTTIEVKMPRKDVNWGDGSDLHIRIPHGSRLRFEGVSSDVAVRDVLGGSSIRTVSGDVKMQDVADQLVVNTVSGDVEIDKATGPARVSTISGEVELDVASTEVDVDSVSGDVDLDLETFDRLYGKTVSGEFKARGKLGGGGSIDVSSVSGDVELSLSRPVDARVRIRTGVGGDITNRQSDDEPRDVFPTQQVLEANLGNGNGRITVSTVNADVRLD
ncbi:MAG: DUF4097 family beta strand repeat protein [Pseudomonadales bacterium]|nr:DUF4097 family beta strand repeat protein [Pseudomonadales bacterium]